MNNQAFKSKTRQLATNNNNTRKAWLHVLKIITILAKEGNSSGNLNNSLGIKDNSSSSNSSFRGSNNQWGKVWDRTWLINTKWTLYSTKIVIVAITHNNNVIARAITISSSSRRWPNKGLKWVMDSASSPPCDTQADSVREKYHATNSWQQITQAKTIKKRKAACSS